MIPPFRRLNSPKKDRTGIEHSAAYTITSLIEVKISQNQTLRMKTEIDDLFYFI